MKSKRSTRRGDIEQAPTHTCNCAGCACGTTCDCGADRSARCAPAASDSRRGGGAVSATSRSIRSALGVAAFAAALLAVDSGTVAAQVETEERAQSSVALSFVQTRPVGALSNNIGLGYGGVAALIVPLDRRGVLSLRVDGGMAEYGQEETRTAFSESVGGRVEVEARTVNAVVPMSLGMQLSPFTGPIRPYAHAGIGGQAFYTESSVQPVGGGVPLVSTINQWDVALAWVVGGGFYLPVRAGARSVMLDIGAQYVRGGTAEYLAPGSIVDTPNGEIEITPMESGTQMLVLHIGARIGL